MSSKSPMTTIATVLGVLAVGTAIPAWYRSAPVDSGEANLTGALLVRDGKEIAPDQIADLMVATWDESQTKAKIFQVKKSDGRWTIPSHFNYPADGGSRVGSTVGGVLNVARGPLVSRDPKRFEDLGVINPTPKEGLPSEKKGIGKRITLKDVSGKVVVDLLIGSPAPNGDGVRFVRDVDSNDVYTAKISDTISTAFTDWVETGLLKFETNDVRSVLVNDYFIEKDPQTGTGKYTPRAETAFTRKDSSADWISGQLPTDMQVAKDAVNKILSEATGLKLAGVRPYNPQWLQMRGFYSSGKDLFGDEGRLVVSTKDGLRYILFFGQIALGDEEDKDSESAKKSTDAGKKEDATSTRNRYLAIFVQYDETCDEEALKAAAEKQAEKKDEAKKDDKKEDKKDPKQVGMDKAQKAQARFQQFFYVISDESFKSMKPAIDKLFEAKPKPEEKKDGMAAPAAPAPSMVPSLMPEPGK